MRTRAVTSIVIVSAVNVGRIIYRPFDMKEVTNVRT